MFDDTKTRGHSRPIGQRAVVADLGKLQRSGRRGTSQPPGSLGRLGGRYGDKHPCGAAYVKHNGGSDNGPEATVMRNALEYAEAYPDIVRWLLVGRYSDQDKISYHATAAAAAHVPEMNTLSPPTAETSSRTPSSTRTIERVMQVQYTCIGTNQDYGQMHKEPRLAYLLRIKKIKASLRDKVIVPYT